VLFTADRTFWGLGSRRTAQARPQPDGSYRISSLPPGEYYVSAVVQVDGNDFTDPTFFEQLIDASFKITLAEGEKRVQDLRLAGERFHD
jgi:hypothetical protein